MSRNPIKNAVYIPKSALYIAVGTAGKTKIPTALRTMGINHFNTISTILQNTEYQQYDDTQRNSVPAEHLEVMLLDVSHEELDNK